LIYQIETNIDNQKLSLILLLTEKQKYLAELFSLGWPSVENRKKVQQTQISWIQILGSTKLQKGEKH